MTAPKYRSLSFMVAMLFLPIGVPSAAPSGQVGAAEPAKSSNTADDVPALLKARVALAEKGYRNTFEGLTRTQRFGNVLIPVAKQLGFKSLWITCDPDNVASRRSLELAGAQFVEIVEVPEDCIIHKYGHPRKCRYRIDLS